MRRLFYAGIILIGIGAALLFFAQPATCDGIWYFAYGSNINIGRLAERVQNKTELIGEKAILNEYNLTFSIYANIIPGSGEVRGVLYCLTVEEMDRLDAFESAYYRKNISVQTYAGKMVGAVAYKMIEDRGYEKPPVWYLDIIIAGLTDFGFEQEYIDFVKEIGGRTGCCS